MNIIGNNVIEISSEEKAGIATTFGIIIASIKADIENL